MNSVAPLEVFFITYNSEKSYYSAICYLQNKICAESKYANRFDGRLICLKFKLLSICVFVYCNLRN